MNPPRLHLHRFALRLAPGGAVFPRPPMVSMPAGATDGHGARLGVLLRAWPVGGASRVCVGASRGKIWPTGLAELPTSRSRPASGGPGDVVPLVPLLFRLFGKAARDVVSLVTNILYLYTKRETKRCRGMLGYSVVVYLKYKKASLSTLASLRRAARCRILGGGRFPRAGGSGAFGRAGLEGGAA
jgi:hypothetical protein